MRTAVANEDSVVEDGQPIALPLAPGLSTRNMVLATGPAVQVFASGTDTIRWAQQATPQQPSVIVGAGSSLTFFYALGTWWVVAEGNIPLSGAESIFTAAGQLLVGTGGGTGELLGPGTVGQALYTDGSDASTLTWAAPTTVQPSWTQSTTGLPSRYAAAAGYDSLYGTMVVFGGITLPGGTTNQDTYTCVGRNNPWILTSPASKPSARSQAAMAYQASGTNQGLILFGGMTSGGTALSSSYKWVPATPTWTTLSPATHPTASFGHAMCYFSTISKTVLTGGSPSAGTASSDTWLYDGSTWTNPAVSTFSARTGHAMAVNTNTKTVVMFGGDDGTGSNFNNETWLWDGTNNWYQAFPLNAPQPRMGHSMCTGPDGNVYLFGGDGLFSLWSDEIWMWDGYNWTQLASSTSPPVRTQANMVLIANTSILMAGGQNPGGSTFSDSWGFIKTAGPPSSGTYYQGQIYIDSVGVEWVCQIPTSGNPQPTFTQVAQPAAAYGPSFRAAGAPTTNSFATATEQVVIPSTVYEDTAGGWNSTTGVYTIQRAGMYEFWANTQWPLLTGAQTYIAFASSSAGWALTQNFGDVRSSSTDGYGRQTNSGLWRFAVGDTLAFHAYQSSGSTQAITLCPFVIIWIRP